MTVNDKLQNAHRSHSTSSSHYTNLRETLIVFFLFTELLLCARHCVDTEVKEPRCLVQDVNSLADTKHSTVRCTAQQTNRPRTDLICPTSQVGQVGGKACRECKIWQEVTSIYSPKGPEKRSACLHGRTWSPP